MHMCYIYSIIGIKKIFTKCNFRTYCIITVLHDYGKSVCVHANNGYYVCIITTCNVAM